MNILSMLAAVEKPQGMWENILFGLEGGGVLDFVVVLILLAIIIRACFLPLDFINRLVMKRSMAGQAELAPQIQKIQKKYGHNKQLLNQKMMEFNRQNGNMKTMVGTCLFSLLYMVASSVVFITLANGITSISGYKIDQQYLTVKEAYYQAEAEAQLNTSLSQEEVITIAQTAAIDKYNEVKTGFLWIKNIWQPDTSAGAVLDYKAFLSKTGQKEEQINKDEYEKIMTPVIEFPENKGWNGIFLIVVLSAAVTYLNLQISIWIERARAKRLNKPYNAAQQGTMKTMMYIMPVLMGIFTLLYTSAFGIYVVSGAMFMMMITPLSTMAINKIDETLSKKEKNKTVVEYSRNAPAKTVVPEYSRERLTIEAKEDKTKKETDNKDKANNNKK